MTNNYEIEFRDTPFGTYMEVKKDDEILESGIVMTNIEQAVMQMTVKHQLPDETKVIKIV